MTLLSATERQAVPGATLADLNLNQVRDHIESAVRRRGYIGDTEPEVYLRTHGCLVDVDAPTLAGIVMFGREPSRFVPICGINIAQFSGSIVATSDLVFSRQIRGDLATIIDRTIDLLWARTEHRTRIDGSERIEDHAYPNVVLRELTVNAIIHRDWSYDGTHVRVQIFNDRIEWISPGGFPGRTEGKLTLDMLVHAQVNRNPMMAQLLYQAGRVESFGMGIDSVLNALHQNGGREPEVFENRDIFLFRVFGKQLRASDIAVVIELTARQQRILAQIIARKVCSPVELYEALNENERSIRRDIQRLLDLGLIIAEGATSRRTYRPAET